MWGFLGVPTDVGLNRGPHVCGVRRGPTFVGGAALFFGQIRAGRKMYFHNLGCDTDLIWKNFLVASGNQDRLFIEGDGYKLKKAHCLKR